MDKLKITGGRRLQGKIAISGAKNAALPLLCSCLLTDKKLVLENVPDLADIYTLRELLQLLGVSITKSGSTLELCAETLASHVAPYDLVRKMRASILVLGPLVARLGKARVSLPGGCAIGTRPVDLHIAGLKAMGAKIEIEDGYIIANAEDGLVGADYEFPIVSVTGTENLMMAAVYAKGITILRNAACEPEVVDLAKCLQSMGAKIAGAGTPTLTIHGVESLQEASHSVLPDRIETGTYAIAAAITGGSIDLVNTDINLLPTFIEKLQKVGCIIEPHNNGFKVTSPGLQSLNPVDISTAPYPGFPTDLQAQMMALLCGVQGTSRLEETIFENRFMHAPELMRMNAKIDVDGSFAEVTGVEHLKGAPVMATDLRASVSLVLAGLAAEGDTVVDRIYHLDRGYENLEAKLGACGAIIERISDVKEKPQLRAVS